MERVVRNALQSVRKGLLVEHYDYTVITLLYTGIVGSMHHSKQR